MRTFRFLLLSLLALTGSLTSSPAYSLSRGAANTPALSATPESMAFADFPVGVSSSPSPVEFTNTSDLQISIAAVSIVGMHSADFRIDSEDCQNSVLAPGNTCSVAVVFEPTSPGVRRGQLQLDGTPLGLRARVPLAGSSDVTFFDGFELAEPIPNSAPTADAGEDADTGNGIATALDGSGSFDPDGQPLIHLWQLQGPAGSSAALDNTGFASPSFTPDVVGDYLATLRVSDRTFVSAPDTVAVRALPRLTVGSRVLPTFFTDDLAISLEAAAGAGGVEISIANPAPSPVSAPAAIAVPQGDNSAAVPLESAALAGSTTIGASAPDYWPDQGLVTVQPRGMTFEVDPLVRIGGSNPGAIVLDLPAPTGGISVALASDLPGLVDLAPASVPIAAGETRAPITISGEGAGPASLSATATGYADAEATVAGTTTTVDLAIIPTLVVDDEIALAVSLSEPAPAGGVALELQSSDPTVLAVDASVFVAAGASAPDPAPLARALAAGTARVSVRATGYAPDFGDAEVLDFSLTFSPDPVAVPAGWTEPVTISLAQPAPAGGRTIELSSSDESLFTVPASVFVAEGDTVAGFEVAGIAQGAGTLTAGGVFDLAVTVDPPPAVSIDPLAIETFSAGVLTVRLARPARAGGVEISLVSDAPAVLDPPATASMAEGLFHVDVPVQSTAATGGATISASAIDYSNGSGSAIGSPRTMGFEIDPLVAIGNTNPAEVLLDRPAPAGGVNVGLSSSDPSLVSVDPAGVFIAEGDTAAAFSVTGESGGSAVITATATGFADADVLVGSTSDTVSVGEIPRMTPGKSVSLPISLSEPAPPGGTTILLESMDPSVATVNVSVFIAEGNSTPPTNPQVTGIAVGSTVITARAEDFAPDSRTATVSPFTVSLSQDPLQVFEGWVRPITVTLSDSAPPGGLELTLVSADESVFTTDPTVLVAAGQTTAGFEISGIAPGASTLSVSGTDVESAVFDVNVDPTPDISINSVAVGEHLQTSQSVRLSVSPPGDTEITLTVADGSTALISADPAAVGSTSITFRGVDNTSSRTFYVQGIAQGSTTITASAAGYNDAVRSLDVTPSGFHLVSSDFGTTTFSGNSTIDVRLYRLRTSDAIRLEQQELRPGFGPVDVAVTSSDPAVGAITASPLSFQPNGGSRLTTGFDPATAGMTTVAITHPDGFAIASNSRTQLTATVDAPNISIGNVAVGEHLQTSHAVSLSVSPPGDTEITLTVADGSTALISADPAAVGSTSITFSGVDNTSSRTFYVQGIAQGSTTITASAAGYNDAVRSLDVTPSGFHLVSSDFGTTTFSGNSTIDVRLYRLRTSDTIRLEQHELRPGFGPVEVAVTSSDPAVGAITASPLSFQPNGGSRLTTGFDPATAGVTTVAITHPDGFAIASNSRTQLTATVTE